MIFLPTVLITGFFTAGTNAGTSCNTFPKVGNNWFYNSNHFIQNIPLWKNFTENKLICQVNHRSIATILTLWFTYQGLGLLRIPLLSKTSKASILFLIATLWTQLSIGVNVIWNSVPINLASLH